MAQVKRTRKSKKEVVDQKNEFTFEDVNELEERRVAALQEAGIDEDVVLGESSDSLRLWSEYFNENITRGKADSQFLLKDQWNNVERNEFIRLGKTPLTFNKLYDATKKILGEQRKNKPDLMVRSLTGKASQEQIDLRSDILRSVAYQSQNDLVYQTAFRSALYMGYGAFQIYLDYESPKSFHQVIRYCNIPDPTMCAFDPTALKPHKGDGNFCSRIYLYSLEEFSATYPNIQNPVSFTDSRYVLDMDFRRKDTIAVCFMTRKEWYPLKVYKLSNGLTVTESEWEDLQKEFAKRKELARDALVVGDIIIDEIPKIVSERQTQEYKVRQYKLLKDQIIDFTDWPSKHLDIIFVDGDSCFIEGKQYTHSFVQYAKDAQRFINYVGSEIATEIKNRRREQWLGTPDNITGYEQIWRNPEMQNGMLVAKPDPKSGQMPIKMPPWDLSPSLMQNFQRASQDVNEILGFSEAEQLQGRDISGKARRERKLEGSMSAYVYFDNLNQAIEQGGRLANDLISHLYGNDERFINLTKRDGNTKPTILNQRMSDGSIQNQVDDGEYDVEIDTGPSFAVQKDIALEFLQQTLQAFPNAFPLVADLWAKNLDVQFMPQLAERFKTMVPPQIIAKEEGLPPPPPPPPSPEQQMMQAEMQNQQQALLDRAHELQIRQEKHELEKIELAMKAKELQEKLGMDKQSHLVEVHKTNLDYNAKIAKILADLNMSKHKSSNQQ